MAEQISKLQDGAFYSSTIISGNNVTEHLSYFKILFFFPKKSIFLSFFASCLSTICVCVCVCKGGRVADNSLLDLGILLPNF